MANYRTVMIDKTGKPGRSRSFVCDSDDDAVAWSKQSLEQSPVELWSGARFIERFEPPALESDTARPEMTGR